MKAWPITVVLMLVALAPRISLSSPLNPNAYLDSDAISRTLTSDLIKLHNQGLTTDMKTLRAQLSRKSCSLHLSAPYKSELSPSELYLRNKDAVLVVAALHKCGKCDKWHAAGTATGFLISADGVMLTNYHVIREDSEALAVMTYYGEIYPVTEVLAASEHDDIAILKLDGIDFPYLRFAKGSPVGEKVWAISNPAKQFYTLTDGIISSRLVVKNQGHETKRLSVTINYAGGSSGAPVFDVRGNVVGMVCGSLIVSSGSKSESIHFHPGHPQFVSNRCVPSELILAMIESE